MAGSIMIRRIEHQDVPALFVVRVATRENVLSLDQLASLGITEATIHEAIEGSHAGWLYEDQGRVVAFAMGDYEGKELTVIAVLPDYEKQGIGGQLLTQVENWLKSKGCDEICLSTDLDVKLRAYGFYRKWGWVDNKIEKGYRYMRKRLN